LRAPLPRCDLRHPSARRPPRPSRTTRVDGRGTTGPRARTRPRARVDTGAGAPQSGSPGARKASRMAGCNRGHRRAGWPACGTRARRPARWSWWRASLRTPRAPRGRRGRSGRADARSCSPAKAYAPAPMRAAVQDVPDVVKPPPGNPRFPLFDSLRAFAALSVLASHTAGLTTFAYVNDVLGPFTARLNVGVTIFFVISGFLIYRPFVSARMDGRAAPHLLAYGRRRLR